MRAPRERGEGGLSSPVLTVSRSATALLRRSAALAVRAAPLQKEMAAVRPARVAVLRIPGLPDWAVSRLERTLGRQGPAAVSVWPMAVPVYGAAFQSSRMR